MSEGEFSQNKDSSLPPSVIVSKFTAARCKEIQIMTNTLLNASSKKLVFQKLPRHMRRRAMSHNAKRLPRRLREIHINQMKKSGLLVQQKPFRKCSRRPSNLITELVRKRKKYKWLDTHLWHAKRFYMIEKWGYKLPFRPCDKTFRACYRATVNHCLLQDISYYRCIEIVGKYDIIVDNFKKISDARYALTIGAKMYAKGSREGSITIFKIDDSKRAIGTLYFNWKPSPICTNKHVLWIWAHAAYYKEALDTLLCCFNLKLNSRSALSDEEMLYTNLENIELKELNLKRFRLTGPLSNSILKNCFCLSKNNENIVKWTKYNSDISEQIKCQSAYWEIVKNVGLTAELPSHMVLSLIIEDPRLNFPKKRTKAVPELLSPQYIYSLPENLGDGPIWDYTSRKYTSNSKQSNAALSLFRKNVFPGLDLNEKATAASIMLIQRPGNKCKINLGYSSGWDIVMTSAWAQPIWISLIMWGARPGGLKETDHICFEMNKPNLLYPDTLAGVEEEQAISNRCKEIYYRLPLNKRTNYNKLKIASPFNWNWNLLLNDWNESSEPINNFFVLRDQHQLRNIQDILSSKSKIFDIQNCFPNYLVPVSIKFLNKGLCKKFSIICLPQENDLKAVPTEEICLDKNEKLRKELRKNHKALLKRLRRRRIKARKDGKVVSIDKEIFTNYRNKMRELWLPQATTIRYSCSREVIGFVRDGDFSFLLGQSKAIGYIVMNALPSLMSLKSRQKVLVRNTNSKQYRLGILEVII